MVKSCHLYIIILVIIIYSAIQSTEYKNKHFQGTNGTKENKLNTTKQPNPSRPGLAKV